MDSDLIIIGSGPGGYEAAPYAASKGLSVTIFEDNEPGGTCLNVGCIPTKTLCHAADVIYDIKGSDAYGITNAQYEFDLQKLMSRKNEVVNQLRSGIEGLLSSPNITYVRAKATIKDAHTVTANGEEYTAKNIIIATGSTAAMPPIKGIDLPNVVSSTEMLSLESVPKRLCIIGAGVIGMELASAFSAFGSDVTIVEFLKECLPPVDADIAKRLRKQMERRGIKFFLQSKVTEITPDGVIFEAKGKENKVEADTVLVATGRKPNFGGIELERLGINFDRHGISVDDNYETSVSGIYAIGDVNGRMMLAHAATFQGFHTVNHIIGNEDNIHPDIMPSAIFTNPEVASVGLTEDKCKDSNIDYKSHKSLYRANGKALSMGETDGIVKLMTDADNHIIGCHIMGPHAADLVQEVTVLMNAGLKLDDLHQIVHIHPTLGEILMNVK
jgi:dihydrolipoamide dehydrogenase